MDGEFLYFLIKYIQKSKENTNDIKFVIPEKNELKPESIYIEERYENPFYYYYKVFRVSKSQGKENYYYFQFEINDEKSIIKFYSKGCNFVYDIKWEFGQRTTDIRRKISQNKENYETFEYFSKTLKKNGEERLINNLYKETINLYAKKKGFTFLIILFLQIYKKNDLCSLLLQIFKKMNEIQKDNENNLDRKSFLKDYRANFKSIVFEADTLIKNNNYNLVELYGIILCYLNYYDFDTFNSVINDLKAKRPKDLYEILIIYKGQFKYPINQDYDFYNNFIMYVIEYKDFQALEKVLNYIKDIETYLNILEKNKKLIFEKYNSKKVVKIIKLDKLEFLQNESQNEIATKGTISIVNLKKPMEIIHLKWLIILNQ